MTRLIQYRIGLQEYEGYLSVPDAEGPYPGVLLVPTWLNVNRSIRNRADRLAALGYACFVVDLFGAGVRPRPPEDPMDVVKPLLSNRKLFRKRLIAGLRTFQLQPESMATRIAAVGYCLGGCGVLELARMGADVRGVVCLHGLLTSVVAATHETIGAKVLVLHGDSDPLSTFHDVSQFASEMRTARANWELTFYGGAKHSFSGEGIVGLGTPEASMDPQAEDRSWHSMLNFLGDVLK